MLELPSADDSIMFELLAWAIEKQPIEVIEYLIEQGVNVNAKSDSSGLTPLHYAAMGNSPEVVQSLISKGADVRMKDRQGMTPLHHAAESMTYDAATKTWDYVDILENLISAGADVHAKDYDNMTPLDYARTEEKKHYLREAMAG
jgi:ankyrin repeat protein